MKYIVYISLIALLLTPTYQQVVPDASLDQFLAQYVGAWLSANLGAYLNAALAPLLNKLATLEAQATAPVAPVAPVAPIAPVAPVAPLPVFPPAPPSGGILCYSCNENWLACKTPIDVGRVEGNLVRCNGQCVKFQNPNDGMKWYRGCSTDLGYSGYSQPAGQWVAGSNGATYGFCNTDRCNGF